MKYPVLSLSRLTEIANKRVQGLKVEVDPHVEWVGSGPQIDLGAIEIVAESITLGKDSYSGKDTDRFEGLSAQSLYDVLSGLPIQTLDDRGFWRYLSARHFWEFINWRHRASFRPEGTFLKYVDGTINTEAVLVRMYLRAAALGGQGIEDLAGGIVEAADFWRSHVIRVQTGSATNITRAFAMRQKANRKKTKPLRTTAKRLNRLWSNVVLHVYDEEEADDIFEEIWQID